MFVLLWALDENREPISYLQTETDLECAFLVELREINRIAEQAEKTASRTGHRRIDGSHLIKTVLDSADFRMQGKDALLEIVGQFLAPGLYWLLDYYRYPLLASTNNIVNKKVIIFVWQ